jgi:small subunit ribosomal protein S17
MTDEKKETQDETPDTPAEDSEGSTAGPVGAGDPPPPAVAEASSGEVPPTPPPAGEASEAQDEAPAEEPAEVPAAEQAESEAAAEEPAVEGDAPAADESAAAPSEEDDLPWKEKRRLERSRRPHEAGPQQSPEEREAARVAGRKRKAGLRRAERAAAKAKHKAGTGTPPAERDANAAKVRQGIVVSDKGEKSITVRIDIVRRHATYEKVVRNSRTLHAHDERNEAGEGDVVRVVETRPLSKTKRWRLVEVLEKAK